VECGLCGTVNRATARFCGGCGAPLARHCSNCKAELDPGLRFCDQCGSPVDGTAAVVPTPASGGDAVRKTVTVLFADLGGSTGFGERTDPEVARQVLARYHALLQDVIDVHGGTVAKFMGDGMMATFGIPEVAEDDAERAVRAGVDIQDRFARFADDVDAAHGERLTARVGVNTGEVVIGAADADLVGDALNVAARLEKACRPGHVLVGDETWRLTRGVLAYESLGEVTVAGRAQPVGTYEVAAGENTAESVAPFVGRDGELHRLIAAFDHARADRTAVLVTVLGSPGLGKTRLSRELAASVGADDAAATYEIRCDRAGGSTFAPVADLLREAAGLEDTDSDTDGGAIARERIGALVGADPEGERVVEVLAGVVGVAPARSVEETFWAIRRIVESLAAPRPLLVVIDDIQWAEPKLLDLLEHLAEWVSEAPVLLVALARPELRELRPSLVEPGRRVADVVALDGLDRRATEALASGLLGSALPRDLVDRLPASTDGNPLFVRELVRMLVDDRVIRRRDDGTWELAIDAEAVEVPPTIQSLLATRVERLPADELRALELASVVGAEFSVGALRELGGDGLPIPALLERLRRKELVEPTGTYWGDEPIHRFHHVLIRDAAYRRLLKGTRAELHQRVGAWTDATAPGVIGEHEPTIAFHYEQAHRYRTELGTLDDETDRLGRRAAELLEIAARRALDRDDLASAGALAGRALAVLPAADTATRSELLLMACECLLASGAVAAGAPLVEQLTALGGADEQLGAWGACFHAQLVALTDPEGLVEAEASASRAAERLRGLGDGAGEAKAHQVRALLLARLGRVGEAEAVLDLALGAARAADDRRRVTAVLGAAPQAALFGPSPVARAGGRCLDVVRLLRITTASPSVEATSMRCQAVLEALRGRFDVSRSMLASSRAALEELGLRHGLLETDLYAGMVELLAADAAAAVAPLRAAYEGLGTLGVGADAGQAAALLATALLDQGDTDEAELMAAESEALAGQNLKTAIAWRTAKAAVLSARGEVDAAVAIAQEAVDIAGATDLILDHADACVVLADLRDAVGDRSGARDARAEARRLYVAKGATVPAERLDQARPVEDVAPVYPTVDDAGRIERMERFEPDPDAASARPEQLVAAGRPRSRPENLSTRVLDRWVELVTSGRLDEAAAIFHPDVERHDHTTLVAFPTVAGAESYADLIGDVAAVGYRSLQVVPLAVRGERLNLAHTTIRTADGFETVSLYVNECDDDGLATYSAEYDELDLGAAIADLDARFLAGEGAPYAPILDVCGRFVELAHRNDRDGLLELLSPDLVVVDHLPIGVGEGDLAHFLETLATQEQVASVGGSLIRSVDIVGSVVLAVSEMHQVTPEGNDYLEALCTLIDVGPSGRIRRIERYPEESLATAHARLLELGHEAPRRVRIENRTTRAMARTADLAMTGRFDELRGMLADGFRRTDRRSGVSAPTADGPDAFVTAYAAWFDVGFERISVAPVAVRGESVALARLEFGATDGRTVGFLGVYETNGDGDLVSGDHYDEDDLVAAMRELDQRYVAGEGARHERVLRICRAFGDANDARDFDAMQSMLAPDFVMDDRTRLGYGTGDRGYFDASSRSLTEVATAGAALNRLVQIDGDALLTVTEGHQVTPEGNDYVWVSCIVFVVGPDDLIHRAEYFDEDRYADAAARLHELGAAVPTALIDNAARRSQLAFVEAVNDYLRGGDPAVVAQAVTTADDFVIEDRRTIVAMPDQDAGAVGDVLATFRAQGDVRVWDEPVAIRGDRLCLAARTWATPSGDETRSLTIDELDEHGRLRRVVLHDGDALDAAVADLDARFLAGEGSGALPVLAAGVAWIEASRAQDIDALRTLVAPELLCVDHQPLGFGTLDREGLLAATQLRFELSADDVVIVRSVQVDGRALLALHYAETATEDRSRYEREAVYVLRVDAAGRIDRWDVYGDGQHDAALARFRELAAPRTGPVVENAASRVEREATVRIANPDAGDLSELAAPDMRLDDRRSIVNLGHLDRSGQARNLTLMRQQGYEVGTPEVVAVRGERLCLSRRVARTPAGDESPVLAVNELDEWGRWSSMTFFDADALDAALDELDERFAAGEGAEHEYTIRRTADARRATAAHDWAAVAALVGDDFTFRDHRPIGLPAADRAAYVAAIVASAEQTPGVFMVGRTLEVHGNVTLSRTRRVGATREGLEDDWEQIAVIRWAAGLLRDVDLYALEDATAARERFEELAARSLTPCVDNAQIRLVVRQQWLVLYADTDPLALYADDCVLVDRRSSVNAGEIAGKEAVAASIQSGIDVFGSLDLVPLAARGDRVTLYRWAFVQDGGFATTALTVVSSDEDLLTTRIESFDESDLADAVDLLETRHADFRGDALTWIERAWADAERALNHRDFDGFASLLAPDFTIVDHRHVGSPMDRDAYLANLRVLTEQAPDSVFFFAQPHVQGDVMFTMARILGTTPDGNRSDWSSVQVMVGDPETGRAMAVELFDDDQWDEAVARVRELLPTEPVATAGDDTERALDRLDALERASSAPDNEAVRLIRRATELMDLDRDAALGLFTADVRTESRETGTQRGTTRVDGLGWGDVLASLVETYPTGHSMQSIATRGERLALTRHEFDADGFVSRVLVLVEVSPTHLVQGLFSYDDSDLARALVDLNERYRTIGGATPAVLDALAAIDALNRRDWDALTAVLDPDLVAIDHQPLGFEPTDRHGFITGWMGGLVAMMPDVVSVVAEIEGHASAVFLRIVTRGDTVDGGEYGWDALCVGRFGTGARLEFFPVDRRDDARALLEAWSTGGRAGGPDNAAARAMVRWYRLSGSGDLAADALTAAEIAMVDRRRGVSLPMIEGRDAFNEAMGVTAEVFPEIDVRPLAVRGERLALINVIRSSDGFELSTLVLVECSAEGRIHRVAIFEESDLVAALAVLDRRHRATAGNLRPVEATQLATYAALNRRDWPAFSAALDDDLVIVDHRRLGFPPGRGAAALTGELQGLVAQVPDVVAYVAAIRARGSAALVTTHQAGTAVVGGHATWDFHTVVTVGPDARVATLEYFDDDRWDDAVARFESAAASRPPAAALGQRITDAFAARDWATIRSITSDDVHLVDRRTTVSSHDAVGADAVLALLQGFADVGFVSMENELVASRAGAVNLFRRTFRTETGFELQMLAVAQLGTGDRSSALVLFDVDDLDAATAELERRAAGASDH
jgi:class 3 adenylate cyclase/ketosteroid isomerase-like protein/tetratricopeptide (TPR) repeat protein